MAKQIQKDSKIPNRLRQLRDKNYLEYLKELTKYYKELREKNG